MRAADDTRHLRGGQIVDTAGRLARARSAQRGEARDGRDAAMRAIFTVLDRRRIVRR
jgi:hypothetical protein